MKQKIEIPNELKKKLQGSKWEDFINTTIHNVQPILSRSPRFFPEYTKHGIDHINNVLYIACRLIPEKILNNDEMFRSEDVGILICSILLHDLGLFLDDSRLTGLLKSTEHKIDGIMPDWTNQQLWDDYCYKVKCLSPRKSYDLTGASHIDLPDLNDYGSWTVRDYLIIGEFLRWYHHRLAFEIAISGFMDIEILPTALYPRSKKLIGLISYSHCLGIRDPEIEEYCDSYLGSKTYIDNCPVYYLIALLRLADYLDAGEERAPHSFSDVHNFLSVTSKKEFELNQCFRFGAYGWTEACRTHALYISADPTSTTQFVKTEKFLLNIQKEFDASTAILDEKYENSYFFTINRITSNILKTKSREILSNKFFLHDTKLSASPDILPLLVGPLYSNNPAYGVRELIQNSVDACKQREATEIGYKGEINIRIDTSAKTFTIQDNGIGMNEDVICNYYLKAGSSYKNSEKWRELYMNNSDQKKIVYTGRFGIGALATFLLGDTATVSTHYVKEKTGCIFKYSLNSHVSIDVIRSSKIATGTSITVNMSDSSCSYFKNKYNREEWSQWYRYQSPHIKIIVNQNELENENTIPYTVETGKGCYRYASKIYSDFIWSYSRNYGKRYIGNELVCNGFAIEQIEHSYHNYIDHWNHKHWSLIRGFGFDIHLPVIFLNDPKNYLKLDLSRRTIEEFPIEPAFVEELYKYLIAQLFSDNQLLNKCTLWESRHGYIPLAHSNRGYTILSRSFILHTCKSIWCAVGEHEYKYETIPMGYIPFGYNDSIHFGYDKKIFINGDLIMDDRSYKSCCRKIISRNIIRAFSDYATNLSDYYGENFHNIYILDLTKKKTAESNTDLIRLLASNLDKKEKLFIEYTPTPIAPNENNIMLKILKKYIPVERNGGWIPYKIEERKQLYPEVYKELADYMNYSS